MEFREKLYALRKERKMSQEDLAAVLGVSRQAVQKWEAGSTSPDMKNLVALSRHYDISLDTLLKDDMPLEETKGATSADPIAQTTININYPRRHYEYKSTGTWLGLPLVHINVGRGFHKAKGIIAVGNLAAGLIAVGGIPMGLLSLGALSLGLLSFGGLTVGGLAIGGISVGIAALGGLALGVLAMGGVAIGIYALGGVAIASEIALGGVARGYLAIGDRVQGAVVLTGSFSAKEIYDIIMQQYPQIWQPLARLFSLILP